MKKVKLEKITLSSQTTPSSELKILHKDSGDVVLEIYDLPGLPITAYATSAHDVKKKQKQVRHSLQCASDAIKQDLGGTGISIPKKRVLWVKFR